MIAYTELLNFFCFHTNICWILQIAQLLMYYVNQEKIL